MEARILSIRQLLSVYHDKASKFQSSISSTFEGPEKSSNIPCNDAKEVIDISELELNDTADLHHEEPNFNDAARSTADVARIDSGLTTPIPEAPSKTEQLETLASQILDVIQRYGQHIAPKDGDEHQQEWIGKPMFMGKVLHQIEKSEPVKMILPAFPWKSINKVDKVTGVLPDLGEELALARLHQMCEDIRAIYPMGGQVWLATDGLVFDDVVGIPDEETWAYSEGLVQITRACGYDQNIRLLRVMDILGYTAGRELTWELYHSLAQQCRDHLMANYGRTEEEVRAMMREDSDTLLTYCGFIRFLESDLRYSKVATTATSGQKYRKCVKKVAINMMIRAESFTKLLQAKYVDYVRLSIHPSTGAVKLSIPLIITATGEFPRTPWHSAIALAVTGTYSTVHRHSVRETHTAVLRDDNDDVTADSSTPYYFREKSALWDWEDALVVFQPQYPNRLLVRPRRGVAPGTKTLTDEQVDRLRALMAVHTAGPVVVEGFANADAVKGTAAV